MILKVPSYDSMIVCLRKGKKCSAAVLRKWEGSCLAGTKVSARGGQEVLQGKSRSSLQPRRGFWRIRMSLSRLRADLTPQPWRSPGCSRSTAEPEQALQPVERSLCRWRLSGGKWGIILEQPVSKDLIERTWAEGADEGLESIKGICTAADEHCEKGAALQHCNPNSPPPLCDSVWMGTRQWTGQ